jgi:hypothetical protein
MWIRRIIPNHGNTGISLVKQIIGLSKRIVSLTINQRLAGLNDANQLGKDAATIRSTLEKLEHVTKNSKYTV